jgi:CBS domain-containing protein
MQVSDILEEKGNRVVSIRAETSLVEIAKILKTERIGAAVVLGANEEISGIVSERDIVRSIAEQGEGAWRQSAADVMTSPVVTCDPESSISDLMDQMLQKQIRHLPVALRGSLVGIISIGDVVKAVHSELKWMTKVLQDQVVASAGWATDED